VSTASFYVAARKSAQSPEVRTLMADLLKRAQARDRMLAEFADHIVANRTRREGKPPKISKAAKDWMREAEDDARRASAGQAERIAKLSDEALLRLALSGWDLAVQLHNPASHHEDDRAFARRIDRHNRDALRLIKAYFRAHGMAVPPLQSGGGIAFITAFRRAIPNVGKLGADCMAIEPALAALDALAEKAKLMPLSHFVNHDPQGLSGEKPDWFDPAAGLATIRGLVDQLDRAPRAVKNGKAVVQELRTLESDVMQAHEHTVRFHFVMLD
jgi:hypothetical protein